MSSIPTKQIDGDVAIGRNVAAGGDANIQGSARIGHDLKVEGWLEARNIKSANKGLFGTAASLREAYPRPHDGWFAGVAATAKDLSDLGVTAGDGKALFRMYVGEGGEWVALEKLYEIVIDYEQTDNLGEELTTLQKSHEVLGKRVEGHDEEITNIKEAQTTLETQVVTNATNIGELAGKMFPKTLTVAQLDTLGATAGNPLAMIEVVKGNGHMRFKVVAAADDARPIGILEVLTDNMNHVITEVLTTHMVPSADGSGMTDAHDCSTVRVYWRIYNFNSPSLTNENLTWTPWRDLSLIQSGKPGGIAPLDSDGKVPSANLPALAPLGSDGLIPAHYIPPMFDDVKFFKGTVENATLELQSLSKTSTGVGCAVLFDTKRKRFVIRETVDTVTKYFNNWIDASAYGTGTSGGVLPAGDKIFVDTSVRKSYVWRLNDLESIGSDLNLGHLATDAFPGNEGAELQTSLRNLSESVGKPGGIAPLDYTKHVSEEYFPDGGRHVAPFVGIVKEVAFSATSTMLKSTDRYCSVVYDSVRCRFLLRTLGSDESYGTTTYYNNWGDGDRWGAQSETGRVPSGDRIYLCGGKSYVWTDGKLVESGGSRLGNMYNVTNELPLPTGEYYDLETAVAAVYSEDLAALGMQITFAIGTGSWKTYQYVGANTTEVRFKTLANWVDLAAMSAGDEPLINVNKLCGGGLYNLSTAIVAVRQKETEMGLSYLKRGIILTYRRDNDVWETKQYLGEVEDISETDTTQWTDFGGGGKSVETSDTPAEGGEDAFSTGGAYALEQTVIADFDRSEDADNIIFQGINKNGSPVGSQLKIPKGGGGSQSGSNLSIFLKDQALYAAYGSRISTQIAVKSTSYDGETEILGVVKRLEIVDPTTGLTLWSDDVNLPSSTSATDYKFTLDFTDFFTSAARRDFTIVATDAEGNVKRRTVTVTAVDVTCTCVQTLHYTQASTLDVDGASKNLLMYKFANNVSKEGVKVTTEMYFGGEWKKLGEATVRDSYSHSITIDPCNVFGGGEKLTHGSYHLRIQGEDVASGVKGNTIYTSVMCVNREQRKPVVSIRFNDSNNGKIRLYDSFDVEVAAFTPGLNSTETKVLLNGRVISTLDCQVGQTYPVRKQVNGYASDGTVNLSMLATSGTVTTRPVTVTVEGSAIEASIKEGALFGFDFATRSNSESDHTITSNGMTMEVSGSNWSSNGFGTFLGENCLRVAENVRARIPWSPFGSAAVERTNGVVFQMAFATKNIKDDEARLVECIDEASGAGFYVCGNRVVMTCKGGAPSTVTRTFRCGEKVTVSVVVEPSTKTVSRGATEYATMRLYVNGESVGCIGYVANSGAILNTSQITMDGTEGDLYLYYAMGYDSFYEWSQAFPNYLCKLSDVEAMIREYDAESVLDNQNRPTIEALKARGIPYYVVVAPKETFDSFDSDIDTSTKFTATLFYFDPQRPWRSFKAVGVQWRRQGTTSAKRPIKNDRFYLKKPAKKGDRIIITALYPDYTNEDALLTYELFGKGVIRVEEDSIPVSTITVKVDYSDSSGANDCGVCDMMNNSFRALGPDYMTPAQRAFDGTWTDGELTLTGLKMNHSTANHPIAAFRATNESLTDAYFHAKGNWKEDKNEQVALGFKDTPGYNLGCLNYGDFTEFFGKPVLNAAGKYAGQEGLDAIETRFKESSGLDTSKAYLLSQYCGRDYRIMRFTDGEWKRSSGSMKQVGGKWKVTGDVLNPVTGYELITYDGMDWWMGVGSVDDMMAPTTTQSSWVSKLNLGQETYPAWTQYFECMVDDDQLQEDLAMGRKVPYELFLQLQFLNSVDYSQTALASTWKAKWRAEAWRYMSVHSLMAYYLFTDYLAAVDQQAKNMQPMFFLEDGCQVVDGVYSSGSLMEPIRMYFNKVYDCDTCNGKDNDGGNTIPATLDPAEDDRCYAGRGSILWNDLRGQQEMQCDRYANTLTLPGVAATMRNLPEIEGVGAGPFSPQGAYHYFLTKRMLKWPKVVSSYDGERKYINYTGYNDLYFYALQGLGLTSLPRFIEQRWRVRDGYYQTGDFKDASHVLGGRVGAKTGAKIYFKAAKDGYFGIGNDGGNVTQGMYLKAGENGEFSQFQHGDNILLYIYQADQMSEIDLSELSLDPNFQFSVMALSEKIKIGSATHRETWRLSPGNTGFLENMNLGDLPFLRELDVQGTEVTTINASRCPRLEKVNATDSALTTISLAETSPIETLKLPATMTDLSLVNLPRLTYPGGMEIAGMSDVQRLMLAGCPNVDPMSLINGVIESSQIRYIRLPDVNITAPSAILETLKTSGAIGLDPSGAAYEETGQCSGMTGRWITSDLIDESKLNSLKNYFPQLNILNSQYSLVCESDAAEDTANISNMDDSTGYKFNNTYTKPGHIKKIEELSKVYRATFNSRDGKMHLRQLADSDYNHLADGTSFDPADLAGAGYDVMKDIYPHWYKGIDDYKNQDKYKAFSFSETEPIPTSSRITRKKLSEILVQALGAIFTESVTTGAAPVIESNPNMNVYEIDVEGMRQVRWPGVNNAQICSVFLDAEGKVISKYSMSVTHALFDFTPGNYIFIDVPAGAKSFRFTSYTGFDSEEAIAVDSSAIEAIEPDWCHSGDPDDRSVRRLLGVYGMSVDALGRARSVSGAVTKRGNGTSVTSAEWTYDTEGNLTNALTPTNLNYTSADMINLCRMRGAGFMSCDYETSKITENIVAAILGDRDVQAQCGYGCSSGYTTGSFDSLGNSTRLWNGSNNGNLVWGFQNAWGGNSEIMDGVARNVTSVKELRRNKFNPDVRDFPIDHKWHVVDTVTGEERVVNGVVSSGDINVERMKNGRHMDLIASRVRVNTLWNTGWASNHYYSAGKGRVVLRGGGSAHAAGGLGCSSSFNAGSYSSTNCGARLAFCGQCVFEDPEGTES